MTLPDARVAVPDSRLRATSSVQVKQTDPGSEFISLESICNSIIGTARSMGVTIAR